MSTKVKALGLLQVDHDKLQIEVNRLQVEKEALEKQVASGDSTIEELEKARKELIDDMADTFEVQGGFGPSRLREPGDQCF